MHLLWFTEYRSSLIPLSPYIYCVNRQYKSIVGQAFILKIVKHLIFSIFTGCLDAFY